MGKRSRIPRDSEEEKVIELETDDSNKVLQNAWIQYHYPWNSEETKQHYLSIIRSYYPPRY